MAIEEIDINSSDILGLTAWTDNKGIDKPRDHLEERITKLFFHPDSGNNLFHKTGPGVEFFVGKKIDQLKTPLNTAFLQCTLLKSTFQATSKANSTASLQCCDISEKFTIHGRAMPDSYIGWINGVGNSQNEAIESGIYLQGLAKGHAIYGVYNCSHTTLIDLLEAAYLNHFGYSPITAEILLSEWKAFHKANAGRPNAKLLQICHSQGAIHVKNALEKAPQKIRDRVIVVAIAPGAVVPKNLCFNSFNYASERDIVPRFDPCNPNSTPLPFTCKDPLTRLFPHLPYELIILPCHPDANTILDHEFQSPTFRCVLENVLADYERRGGVYFPAEKGK